MKHIRWRESIEEGFRPRQSNFNWIVIRSTLISAIIKLIGILVIFVLTVACSFLRLKCFLNVSSSISAVADFFQAYTRYWLLFCEYFDKRKLCSSCSSVTFLKIFENTLWGQLVGQNFRYRSIPAIKNS